MEIHGYTESGTISATFDGIPMTVPDDPANRHRQMIAEWEAEGNTIPPYIPPIQPAPQLSDEELLRQAMFEDFVERSAKNASTPKAVKDAALRVKGEKK